MFRTATPLCDCVLGTALRTDTAANGSSISVTGCAAEAQRDGSTGAKATGTQATPETATPEANNPNPTGRYHLLGATPMTPGETAKGVPAAYGLGGQETELAKHLGHRVEIAGSLLAPLASKLPPKSAATAEGVRTILVTSVKMVGTNCTAKPPVK